MNGTLAVMSKAAANELRTSPGLLELPDGLERRTTSPKVIIFNDLQSNITFSSLGAIGSANQSRRPGQSIYFEGTNIIVYIRGTEDEEGEWWNSNSFDSETSPKKGGVLVNAHYDRYVILKRPMTAPMNLLFCSTMLLLRNSTL